MFEELDFRRTIIGDLSLRRRTELTLGVEVFEIKLGDEFLMSSLFTAGEVALADLGLAACDRVPLDVLVGGLGLGHTARAALKHPALRSLVVIEAIPEVIDWHRRGLVPLGRELSADPRCHLMEGDFFALAKSATLGFDAREPGKRFHAILLDIDHAPNHVLHPSHACFYEPDGLRRIAAHLLDGGVFAVWSNDLPNNDFLKTLSSVFPGSAAHVVRFHNALQNREAENTIYVAQYDARA
jgi:spermidine synthase